MLPLEEKLRPPMGYLLWYLLRGKTAQEAMSQPGWRELYSWLSDVELGMVTRAAILNYDASLLIRELGSFTKDPHNLFRGK